MDSLTLQCIILAGEIGLITLGSSKIISEKNKKIETHINDMDFDIEPAPDLTKLPEIRIDDLPEIKDFIIKISECPYFNQNIFLHNLQNVSINEINPLLYILKNLKLGGRFDPKKNLIEYANIPSLKDLILNHEFLHVSTYLNTEKVKYCGLRQIRGSKEIAAGMDEAMDMHILKKYFQQSHQNAYNIETILFDNLTKITPFDFLEKCYFEMDLLKLVNHLENYDDKLNIIRFIRFFDFMHEHDAYAALFKDKQFNEVILFISKCLIKWYTLSSYERTLNNHRSEDEFLNQIIEYIDALDYNYKLLRKKFASVNNDIINDSIMESDIPLSTKQKVLKKALQNE